MSSGMRKVIFIILLVGITCIAYQFMIKPANRNLAEQKSRLNSKLEKLEEFKKVTSTAQNINKQFEELKKAVEFFESRIPPTSEIDQVLRDVTVITEKQGLVPKTIRTLRNKDNSGYIEQPMRMKLVGNFNAFYSFLLELEKLPRIMKIRQLNLKKNPDKKGQIISDFIVSIFFQNEKGQS